ncbi:MAG: putative O-succinylbenzoate--CoA ligase [Frankiales bacterium]|nr:putative O-succinylbenzoate--CoA ligase [Frankiales bacterium]
MPDLPTAILELPPGATAWDLVQERARRTPDGILSLDRAGRTLTFAQLRDQAEELAGRLLAEGVQPGSVVSWQLPSWTGAHVLTAALSRLGVVQNPLIPMLRRREVGFICGQARTGTLIVPATWRGFDHAAMAAEVAGELPGLRVLVAAADGVATRSAEPAPLGPPPTDAHQVSWYFYTSGTTADAKGARHGDDALLHAAAAMVERLGLQPDEQLGLPSPLTHVGGIIGFYVGLLTGARMLLEDAFHPVDTALFFREQGATRVGIGVPFFLAYLDLAARTDGPLFPQVRAFLSGGAPKPRSLHATMKERFGGAGIVSGYGMTECPMLAWAAPGDPDDVLAGTEGRAIRGVEVVARDADGKDVPVGEEGELCVRGPQLMQGYVDPALDAAAFTPDGFLRSGDLVRLDAAGNIEVTGRVKDIIIRNMENVSAREVEELLLSHPGVREAAVIGLPDPQVGERICAVVAPVDPAAPPALADLVAHLTAQGLSSRKLPERLQVVAELPRNAMGKVLKNDLRTATGPSAAPVLS